ncbi:MAG: spermidine synthase, partial [Gammaproteobacteria bacterium]|nr:spermidine synthase [Gammaproteobacteria bacterium]
MGNYKGEIIHSSHDAEGVIDVVQDQTSLSLYFGSRAKQSSMYLHDPIKLALSYTRMMMGFLLFNDNPQRILLLGMGGGSLAKFLLHHFPECVIDAVDRRPNVVKLAQGYFRLPQDPRLRIYIDDAFEFMSKNTNQYDAILIDAYDGKGMSDSVSHERFFENCYVQMNKDAVISMNLWSTDKSELKKTLSDIKNVFGNNCLELPIPEKGNLVT